MWGGTVFMQADLAFKSLILQRIVIPNMMCTVVAAIFCPVYNYLLIHK